MVTSLLEYLFWACLIGIFYIYFGYPMLILAASKLFSKTIQKGPCEPLVSILISAYNEEESIGRTIENKLSLDYPKEKIEIIVVSDGSTDATEEIVARYLKDSVKLLRQWPRNGKTSALNMAAREAKGEILVFSDANSLYEKEALRHLMKNFSDPEVGYVTGKMVYTNPDGTTIGGGCSAYMKYENFLREIETRLGSVVGVDGGIDAVRWSLYVTMNADQLPDLILPLKVIERGFRVVYEPKAILKEEALKSSRDEYRMRVRVSLRSLWALKEMKQLFNPFRYGIFSLQLVSHKLLRYLAFLFFVVIYGLNIGLLQESHFYQAIFALQNLFYLSCYLGYRLQGREHVSPLLVLPYYFLLINLAAGYGFIKFLRGTRLVIWSPRTG
ncbi:MAG TPA: glycosyltransferase family 2 protein [Nitrospiria bacterium]|nr:glycosyltransferase family 2 protein [Nitrospiria bacterium]